MQNNKRRLRLIFCIVAVFLFLSLALFGAFSWNQRSQFTEAPWNKVIIEHHGHSQLISTESPPAGLFFRQSDLDPETKYRLIVAGRYISGTAPNLRVTTDDAAPHWYPAPENGTINIDITNAKSIELLLYGDDPFDYSIKDVKLESCPKCMTDRQLRELISRDIPALKYTSDPLKRALLLVHWVARNVDLGLGTKVNPSIESMSAAQMYADVWKPDAGGGSCGAFAVFADKVMGLFGLDSFTVNFGMLKDDLTHVSVVLAVPTSEPGWKYFLIDPTFDATIKKKDGHYAGFLDALSDDKRSADYSVQSQHFTRTFLMSQVMYRSLRSVVPSLINKASCSRLKTEIVKCRSVDYEKFFFSTAIPDGWVERLKKMGLRTGGNALIDLAQLRFFFIGTARDPRASAEFKRKVVALGIPIGYPSQALAQTTQ